MSDKDINETPENESNATAATDDSESISQDAEHAGHDHDHDHDHEGYTFTEDPTFNLDYKGECLYEVAVTVPAANRKSEVERLFGELQADAELPGFRKGKAPRKLLENKMGKHVRAESIDKLVSASFEKIVKDEDLRPIAAPEIDGLEDAMQRKDEEPLEFTLKFEVIPRCELGEYKGLEIERPVLEVSEDDVEGAIKEMRERLAAFETVEGGKAAEGDQVIIDFKGLIDGEEFPGNSAENYPYVIGSKRFFESFENALVGAEAGQEITANVDFPEDYPSEDLVGKAAVFTIQVHEVKRKTLPELNDEFAKMAGKDSLEELREQVRDQIRESFADQSRSIIEQDALDKIVASSTFELPKSLVDDSANEYKEQEIRRMHATNVPAAEISAQEEAIAAKARENALREIKRFVALNEVGATENIKVSEADFEREAEKIGKRTGMEMATVQRFLMQSQQRENYQSRIFREKTMNLIIDNAKINDKVVSREELEKQREAVETDE